MSLHIRTTRFTKETILADLEDLYQRALMADNLAVAFKIKEVQAKALGLLKNKPTPEAVFHFGEVGEEALRQIYDEAQRFLKEKDPTSPRVLTDALPNDVSDTSPKRDSNAPTYW